jgi:hypothetical protein
LGLRAWIGEILLSLRGRVKSGVKKFFRRRNP